MSYEEEQSCLLNFDLLAVGGGGCQSRRGGLLWLQCVGCAPSSLPRVNKRSQQPEKTGFKENLLATSRSYDSKMLPSLFFVLFFGVQKA